MEDIQGSSRGSMDLMSPEEGQFDYLALIRHTLSHWKLILFIWVLGGAMGVSFIRKMPNIYRSSTSILLETSRVSGGVVRQMSAVSLESRMRTLSLQVTSRPVLEGLIERYDLYPIARAQGSVDDAVAAMKKDITLEVRETNAFTLSYQGEEPKVVQAVTKDLSDHFIEECQSAQAIEASSTLNFLTEQLAKVDGEVKATLTELTFFQEEHRNTVGAQEASQSSYKEVSDLKAQLRGLKYKIADLEARAAKGETTISVPSTYTSPKSSGGGSRALAEKETRYREMSAKLKALRGKFNDNYPDVVKLKEQVWALQSEILKLRKDKAAQTRAEVAQTQAMRKASIKSTLSKLKDQRKGVERKLAELEKETGDIPDIQKRFNILQNKYQSLMEEQRNLQARYTEAKLSKALEEEKAGIQFKEVEPANLPSTPFKPKKTLLMAGAVGGALCFGLCIALLIELLDRSFKSEKELERFASVPVLVSVPRIPGVRKRRGILGWMTSGKGRRRSAA